MKLNEFLNKKIEVIEEFRRYMRIEDPPYEEEMTRDEWNEEFVTFLDIFYPTQRR